MQAGGHGSGGDPELGQSVTGLHSAHLAQVVQLHVQLLDPVLDVLHRAGLVCAGAAVSFQAQPSIHITQL